MNQSNQAAQFSHVSESSPEVPLKAQHEHAEGSSASDQSDIRASGGSITLGAGAAKRIEHIVASNPGTIGVRLQVDGGGCSGFQYTYSLVSDIEENDLVIKHGAALLVVDDLSIPFLANSTVDFVTELVGEAFKVDNPNVTSQCGCGVSFSI